MPTPMLKSMKLTHYKGFERHTIGFRKANVLVGANNAGKTTALGALRLIAAMLPQARRIAPTTLGFLNGRPLRGWPVTGAALEASAFAQENIRYDFRPLEARIEVTISNGTKLAAVWPGPESADEVVRAMYFVIPPANSSATPRSAARDLVPTIAVVPTLSPLDDREGFVMDETFKRNLTSRRTSRYFRNALWRLDDLEWQDFSKFVYDRTPEVANLSLHRAVDTTEDDFDLFFTEPGLWHEREIVWAGDGIQIWLQVLYHLWRQRDSPVLILDEPDVFLHPDLQRRLARELFASTQQIVVATHSVEMLSEADPGTAIWIDRARATAERPRSDGALAMLGRRLGSGYELGVARALRSSAVLFVEGDDAPVLALIAARLGFADVASAQAYATVPLGGFTRNGLAGAFAETMTALGGSVRTFVVLDGDLRSSDVVNSDVRRLRRAGATVHVWKRRELENYLLQPGAIAKVSGLSRAAAEVLLDKVVKDQEDEAFVAIQSQRVEENRQRGAREAPRTVLTQANRECQLAWATHEGRLAIVDAKATISALNARLQKQSARTLNLRSLARSLDPAEVPQEVFSLLERLEELISNQ